MLKNEKALVEKLLNKSKEVFVLAVELYNKPTIKYRVEGFGVFICNAWELMLKAHLIKKYGNSAIYYKDNPSRTISLENCIKKIFTNEKAPLRLNLEKIIELRNTSTHFITEEYEMIYVPLFQSCVFNFINKMQEFHNIDMAETIPQNFLTLTVSIKPFSGNEVRAKYPKEIASKIITLNQTVSEMQSNHNSEFSIVVEHRHFITKDRSEATSLIGIEKNADEKVKIIKEIKDPNKTHNFTAKRCWEEINKRIQKSGVSWTFNRSHFDIFCKAFGIKQNDRFCFTNRIQKIPTYSYSIHTIDFIVEEILKDPDNIIEILKTQTKK
jgi:hypothetical protein